VIPTLHLVTDDRVLEASDFLERVRRVADCATVTGGPDGAADAEGADPAGWADVALHLRGPGLSGRRLWELARELKELLEGSGIRLVVNDRVDLALVVGAFGVHLAGRSLPAAGARQLLGSGPLLGRSVHGEGEVAGLAKISGTLDSLDYLMAGTIYSTPSHPGVPGAGLNGIRRVRKAAPALPVVAIGGVTPGRVPELLKAGAHGVAVLRAVWDAPDPGSAAGAFRQALGEPGGR